MIKRNLLILSLLLAITMIQNAWLKQPLKINQHKNLYGTCLISNKSPIGGLLIAFLIQGTALFLGMAFIFCISSMEKPIKASLSSVTEKCRFKSAGLEIHNWLGLLGSHQCLLLSGSDGGCYH